MAEGVLRAGRFGGSAREGGSRALPPYNLRLVAVRAQVSRDAPPPLPGGYKVGEKVFFTGASETFASGNKLVHGQQGEVMGLATGEDADKRLSLLYPGNKGGINCLLTTVRHLCAASAACAPHTRRCAYAQCVPATASAAAPQPSPHAQPLAPAAAHACGFGRCGGRGRGMRWPFRWQCQRGRRPSPIPPYSVRLVAACACR